MGFAFVVLRRNKAPKRVDSRFDDLRFGTSGFPSGFSEMGGNFEEVVLLRFRFGLFELRDPEDCRCATIDMLSSGASSDSGRDSKFELYDELRLECLLRSALTSSFERPSLDASPTDGGAV